MRNKYGDSYMSDPGTSSKQIDIIHQPREIAEARYTLSKDEKRLIILIARQSGVPASQNNEGWYDIKISDYAEAFKLSKHEAGRDVRQAIDNIADRWIYIYDQSDRKGKDVGYTKYRWINKVRSSPRYGKYSVCFSSELLPFIHKVEGNFEYPLIDIVELHNVVHIRIYSLLQMNKEHGFYEVGVEELKNMLMLEKTKSYEKYGDFKRWVIMPTINEIKKSTPLDVKLVEFKEARKVVKLRFEFERKSENKCKG